MTGWYYKPTFLQVKKQALRGSLKAIVISTFKIETQPLSSTLWHLLRAVRILNKQECGSQSQPCSPAISLFLNFYLSLKTHWSVHYIEHNTRRPAHSHYNHKKSVHSTAPINFPNKARLIIWDVSSVKKKNRFTEKSLPWILQIHTQNHKYGPESILDIKHPHLADRQLNAWFCTGVTLGPKGSTPFLTWIITWTPWRQGCFHCQILLK